jgi:hypothetical protein
MPTADLSTLSNAVDATRATRPRRRPADEPEARQVELLDEEVDDPHQVILADPVLKTLREQRHLIPCDPLDETRHTCPPASSRG